MRVRIVRRLSRAISPPSPLHLRLVLAPCTLPPRPRMSPFRIEARILDNLSLVSPPRFLLPPPLWHPFHAHSYGSPCIRMLVLC
jgi:hypothetical protein